MASKQKTITSVADNRTTATDNASSVQVHAGGKKNTNTIAVGQFAIQGDDNTVTLLDGGAIEDALRFASNVVTVSSQANAAALSGALDVATTFNDQIASLSETKLTDGANLNQKTTIIAVVAFAVIALVAFFFLRKS